MGHKVGGVYLVRVTQLVECRTVTADVAGSYPVSYPINLARLVCQPSEPTYDTSASVDWDETTDEDLCLV